MVSLKGKDYIETQDLSDAELGLLLDTATDLKKKYHRCELGVRTVVRQAAECAAGADHVDDSLWHERIARASARVQADWPHHRSGQIERGGERRQVRDRRRHGRRLHGRRHRLSKKLGR